MADKHKILIVEDDKYIINFISMSLKKEDYDYVIAKTCGEANALFYAKRPPFLQNLFIQLLLLPHLFPEHHYERQPHLLHLLPDL